jgi:hypothetical protein
MVHWSWDRVFVLYVHMAKYQLLTPEPPSTPRPVTRVLHRGHIASEHFPPEHQIIALTEYLRPLPVLHAHTEEALGVLFNHLPLRRQSRINAGLINPSKGVSGDAESRV